ncbi:MAG: undecaprenyldiphospho-muramoylpentapeptide beta-N-acetylglucosaminyltransferase [Bdellovibrionales bacterium]|nr:undecaprenyldiphospho-muramoylpentapeptide beta-N-acetylglucosaminyltransferase [Bdellovibrionales bacterium]
MKDKIIIAAGGTGGHIYPALAIAKAVTQMNPECEVHFVGTPNGLETKLIPRENFPLHTITIGRLNRNVGKWERLKTLLLMPWAFVQSVVVVLKLQPKWVLGVGGFASGPVLLVAALMGKKTFVWEPNAYPGMANRWLSPFVHAGLLLFQDSLKYLKLKKWYQVGYPLREVFSDVQKRAKVPVENGLLKILVFGGSQGARAINNVVAELFSEVAKWKGRVEVVHQTGPIDFDAIQAKYVDCGCDFVQPFAYLYDMRDRYQWADLVICRSGAGTLAELAAMSKASILVPLPWAADDHQKKNAQVLVEQKAAEMIEQKDLSVSSLERVIVELEKNRNKIGQMESAIHQFYEPNATDHIVKILSGQEEEAHEARSI